MSKYDKLVSKIIALDKNMRFDELCKVLESLGYKGDFPGSGSSHCTFRKPNCMPITIPKHGFIPKAYVRMVKEVLEREELQ